MCMKKGWYNLKILSLFLLIASITKATEMKISHLQLPSSSSSQVTTNDPEKKPNPNPVNVSSRLPALPPPGSCDVAEIRRVLLAAGNVQLQGLDSTCSLYFINPKYMSGPAAQAYAQTFGANLISIQSLKENDDLKAALVNQCYGSEVVWIGLSDELNEGTFVWYDGSPVTYTNWGSGEPNNSGDEDCTQIFANGTWNDLNCNGYNSLSVIEVSLCPVTTIVPSKLTTICLGDSITLTAKTFLGAPNYNYTWVSNPPGTTSTKDSIKVSPLVTTTYSVSMIDRYKCVSAPQQITV